MDYREEIEATIAAIGTEYRRLAVWFRTFSEVDWQRPSFCPGWTVARVVGHLAFGGAFFASTVRNGLKGDLGFPLGAKDREEFMRIREEMAEEIGALSSAELVGRFEANTADVHALFESLSPEDYERPAWHRRRIFPIRRLVLSRLNELLFHEWDIRNEPETPMAQASLPVAAVNLRQHFQLFYEMDPVEGLAGTFAFSLTDTGRAWAMRVEGGGARDLGFGAHAADVTFSATASDMMLIASGRRPLERGLAEGRLEVEGDGERARAILPKLFFPL